MSALKLNRKKYSIWIDSLDEDLTGSFGNGRFLCADSLAAEGDTLEELIANAEVFTCDQDGGEGPCIRLEDMGDHKYLRYGEMIHDEMKRQDDRSGGE